MSVEELININGIREDLYQAMQIGDITLNSKHSQELYDFMNYQDKEIERLNNIIKEVREYIMSNLITEWDIKNNGYVSGSDLPADAITPILEILGSDKE